MITSTFMFTQVSYDAEFESLNDRVRAVAESTSGYLGRSRWRGPDGILAVTYYWEDMASLDAFRRDSTHKLAKSRYTEWYGGYRVEIAEVLHVYGDGALDAGFPAMDRVPPSDSES